MTISTGKETGIAIVGMGFSGLMTAINIIKNAKSKIKIHLINDKYPFGKGVAYSATSFNHLLNVPAAKMSCFSSFPDHFVDWAYTKAPFYDMNKEIIGKMFLARKEYGNYLFEVWNDILKNKNSFVSINIIEALSTDIEDFEKKHRIHFGSGEQVLVDFVVLATGNDIPGNPKIHNENFFNSPDYFNNPWDIDAVKDIGSGTNILIVGNGLTMVDTVLELMENGCEGKIYSISPHGFTVLPHRYNGVAYSKLLEELKEPYEINNLFQLFRRHIKLMKQFGFSAEPVIDSIRTISQKIWIALSLPDKRRFLFHIKHLWDDARHRLPNHIYDLIQDLKNQNKLITIKGRLVDINETGRQIIVRFWNGKNQIEESIVVSRVINCTGPLPDITKTKNILLKNLVSRGTIKPDALKLGIETDLQGAIINSNNITSDNLFTLGGNLKGLLWESTAVPEIRVQAENLAALLVNRIE